MSVFSALPSSTVDTCAYVSFRRRLVICSQLVTRESGLRMPGRRQEWYSRAASDRVAPACLLSRFSASSGDLHTGAGVWGPVIGVGSGGADSRESDSQGFWDPVIRCIWAMWHGQTRHFSNTSAPPPFQGYDENGLLRSLNGRLTSVHKVLCSAAEIACKGRQDFYLEHDGGYMIPCHSKIGQGMRIHLEKLVNWHGKNELIPVYVVNNFFN